MPCHRNVCSALLRRNSLQEGEMRPQLLDRFGMCVNVTTMQDSDARTRMVLDKLAYEMVHSSLASKVHISVILTKQTAAITLRMLFGLHRWSLSHIIP